VAGRLLIFCGIPGSGKTTIAKLVAAASPKSIHIQTDAVRGMIAQPTLAAEESEFVYAACISVAREALDRDYLVILDGTFGSEKRRSSTLATLEGHYSRVDFVLVVCDLETALRRNRERAATVPADRLKGIFDTFDPIPGALVVDSSAVPPKISAERIVQELLYPLVPPE